jgi:lysophospholipase L1-like esterase
MDCSKHGVLSPPPVQDTPPVCPPGSGGAGDADASGAVGIAGDAGRSAGGELNAPFEPCPTTGDCKILPLGDSITFGNPTAKGGYRVELFARAAADCKHITFLGSQKNGPDRVLGLPFPKNNEGHPGWTIAQLDEISTSDQALASDPSMVLLHIGTNDMFRGPDGAGDRLAALIDKLVAALPNSLLAVSTIIPLPPAAQDAQAYDALVPGIVEARARAGAHIIYVDQFDGFPSDGFAADMVHPNDAVGYAWMGDNWYEAIKQYLH